ncbi:MAG: hypothetical protein M1504_02905, partial [Candidatus Marsarchaeota archaeon]|nr:hypothetical protein [Candidatus Marsarchaeota archaeon]
AAEVAVKDSIYWKQANMKQPISVEKMNEFTGLLEHVAKRIEKFKTLYEEILYVPSLYGLSGGPYRGSIRSDPNLEKVPEWHLLIKELKEKAEKLYADVKRFEPSLKEAEESIDRIAKNPKYMGPLYAEVWIPDNDPDLQRLTDAYMDFRTEYARVFVIPNYLEQVREVGPIDIDRTKLLRAVVEHQSERLDATARDAKQPDAPKRSGVLYM